MKRLLLIFSLCVFIAVAPLFSHAYGQAPGTLNSALIVGTDNNGTTLFFCRSLLYGGMRIGVTWAGSRQCLIPFKGKMYALTQYMIPNQTEFGHYRWAPNAEHAIQVGHDEREVPLFLCQSEVNGYLYAGTTSPGYNFCNIIYKNKEVITSITRILSSM
jgi:hypothetical protein